MADDIRISTTFPHHPKIVRLRRRLGPEGPESYVYLLCAVRQQRPNGDLSGKSTEDLEIDALWRGEPGSLVSTLVALHLLDGTEGRYRIHGWEEHQPFAMAQGQRIEAAREHAKKRWEGTTSAERSEAARHAANARWKKEASDWKRPQSQNASEMQATRTDRCEQPSHQCELTTPPHLNRTHRNTSSSSPDALDARHGIGPSRDCQELAQLLQEEILKNKPDTRITDSQVRNWAVIADRMIRLDGRSPRQIRRLIQWVQSDEFWASNVLSMGKLREKFDQLEMKMNASPLRKSKPFDPGDTRGTSDPKPSCIQCGAELLEGQAERSFDGFTVCGVVCRDARATKYGKLTVSASDQVSIHTH